ncbi:Chromatin assembly factor 1 subunit b-like protein [Leptomonas pyrrhocoris]|uniref:Chromatin assembly factor 1 subunit b-like protein n=1 Tax=Leptomonas pyrrhocoris TaxID=157538 RepID=A0A0M9G1G3_LEPPY|nr:Chromatin assembly factor 1 subunit b-like protein [Leptomonas pyrrhocoris]KPA80236.1 Chromatin assembly factor 1 subunit b-like protein [Leptomonas pyrrhocoris]|eukprot:XP_015658675.1 Chromatin assembly factor 1 subunit b-like protein [Leptomonas pyrrhocoris]
MSQQAENEAGDNGAASSPARPLRVRTIEILWHCNDRNEEAELLGMQSSVMEGITSVDYNPRFDRIVTTGGDGNIRLWEMHTAAIDAWLANNANDMLACCQHLCCMRTAWMPLTARWSPQGEMIASAHCDGKICLWWRDPTDEPSAAASDGTRQANRGQSSAEDGEVEEWKAYRHLTGHISDVYDLCFSADSRYLLSGAGDGSIVIHDLEASTMPVLQLTDLHTKFCRGVAWDPWTRLVHTFGCGPSLLCFTHVPRGEGHRRMHLAGQRRCQGDFIGESCALSYRRLSWSPDGLLLAVPYGKFTKSSQQQAPSTANLLASIEAKERAEAQQTEAGQSMDERNRFSEAATAANVSTNTPAAVKSPAQPHDPASLTARTVEDEVEDMLHCVYIYSRCAPDKVACRLGVRGFSEVRGVRWAPCFLEPLSAEELQESNMQVSQATAQTATAMRGNLSPAAEKKGGESALSLLPPLLPSASKVLSSTETEAARQRRGAWGPADYRMALAVWTSDAVIVYTTDCSTRHSDFTDLHMRSITDVAWSHDASHLYTASLDGYISVIAFGASLAMSHRLPAFSTSPAVRSLCTLMERIEKVGLSIEGSRSSGSGSAMKSGGPSASAAVAAAVGDSGSGAAAPTATTSVVVVRKKRKVERPSAPPHGEEKKKDVDVQQLEALMSDLMTIH